MLIGNDLKQVRRELGLTQKGLAEKLGVSLPTVVNWELGKSTPRGQNRIKLDEFFTETIGDEDFIDDQMWDDLQIVSDEMGFEDMVELFQTIIRKHKLGLLDL